MAENRMDHDEVEIVPMAEKDAIEVARLYCAEIPWSIFSKMGVRFNAQFIRWVQQQEHSEVWVAKNSRGDILGISSGTLDKPRIYKDIVRAHFLKLSASTLMNLWRPGVLSWLFRSFWDRIRRQKPAPRSAPRPPAEWIFLTVVAAARGKGLAHRFHERMVSDFREWGLKGPYVVLPLASNKQAQAFHKKHGAKFIAEIPTRGHLIHEYHKELPPVDDKPDTAF